MSEPLVSIIVPTYNSARTLERCLQSVRDQTYPCIEVLVVDNHSTDETPQIAARYARLISCGPERSAQLNEGARQARGAYLYRIDGDFELEPGVVADCVQAAVSQGWDALVVANRSSGDSFWARVRRLERDAYLDDDLMVAARFWKKEIFAAVGGMDTKLVACEDLDLHNRLLAAGYRIGRVSSHEIHLGEAEHLWDYARQSFYYGPSIWRYLRKNPDRGLRQSFPIRPAFLRHWRSFREKPTLLAGLLVLKALQYGAALAGMAFHSLGLVTGRGQVAVAAILNLFLVVLATFGLAQALESLDISLSPFWKGTLTGAGVVLWQVVGWRRAHLVSRPRAEVLPLVALAYSPLLLHLLATVGMQNGRGSPGDPFLVSWLVAVWVGWLVYLAEIPDRLTGRFWQRVPGLVVGLAALAFTGLLGWRAVLLLETFSLPAFELTMVDQALWSTAQGWPEAATSLLYSSVSGYSLLADQAAPALLLLAPVYQIGLGGPTLLIFFFLSGIALTALALFLTGSRRIGPLPAGLIAISYLVYFVSLRAGLSSFQIEVWIAPLLLFALHAHETGKKAWTYPLVVLALACGLDAGLAVAMLGVYLLVRGSRQAGWIILILGAGWTWIATSALIPFFGGTIGGVLAPYLQPGGLGWPAVINGAAYLARLLAPLGFLPVLGWPAALLALPRLVLNLLGGPAFTALSGWYEIAAAPFLFLAALEALRWLRNQAHQARWFSPILAGSVIILTGCVLTSFNLFPILAHDLAAVRLTGYHRLGHQILSEIPGDASLAVQRSFGPGLAHRRELTILPKVEEPDYIFVDMFNLQLEPQPELYKEVLSQIFHHPDFGLRVAEGGYLLFQRGLDSQSKIAHPALVPEPQVQYPRYVELGGEVAYLGMDLSTPYLRAGETLYITHYWQSLAPVSRPYQLFTAYPGGALIEDFAFGLYPASEWEVGQIVRHVQAVRLPDLPDGDAYELVVGLWFGEGERALHSPEELLGQDVIRVALIVARKGSYQIIPWPNLLSSVSSQP
jgi:glycosyltransferase involved in cell wall biosynthesis/uncharacterized membrane protein